MTSGRRARSPSFALVVALTTTAACGGATPAPHRTDSTDDPSGTGDDASSTAEDPSDTGGDPSGTSGDPSDDPTDTGDDPTDTGDEPDFDELVSDAERELAPDATTDELATMRAGNVDLGFDLLRELGKGGDRNLAVSAVSLRAAFGMVSAMAQGDTATEIHDALGFLADQGRTHNALNAFDLALHARNLPETEEEDPVIYATANRMFVRPNTGVGPMFLDTLAVNYGAGVYLTDFASDPDLIRTQINKWVSARTRTRIPELFPSGAFTPNTQWVLVNATYLKAPWQAPFDLNQTTERTFTRLDDSTVDVPTMFNNELYGTYRNGDDYDLVELTLRGEDLAVTFIVPDAGKFAAQEAAMNTTTLDEMLDGASTGAVEIRLPRFKVQTGSLALVPQLQALGMTTPFASAADFTGINDGDSGVAPISFVYHSVFVAMDEVGVEAAAATGVGGDDSEPDPDFSLDINRPFLFLVRDRPTGLVLFAGRVLDPSS